MLPRCLPHTEPAVHSEHLTLALKNRGLLRILRDITSLSHSHSCQTEKHLCGSVRFEAHRVSRVNVPALAKQFILLIDNYAHIHIV